MEQDRGAGATGAEGGHWLRRDEFWGMGFAGIVCGAARSEAADR